MGDLHNNIKYSRAITPQVQTNSDTAIVSAILDTAGYNNHELVIQLGTLTDADVTAVVLLEEGDDSGLSDNTAVADADMIGTEAEAGFAAADDLATLKLGYHGAKRYIRATVTPTGNNSGALPIAAVWAQSGSGVRPVT